MEKETTSLTRIDKVRLIFERFDANCDGGLDRTEMSALIGSVNPTVKFGPDQIAAVLDEVFCSYANFIDDPAAGLSFAGLLRTYEDGAGNIDRDFAALGFQVPLFQSTLSSPRSSSANHQTTLSRTLAPNPEVSPAWTASPNHGIDYWETWKIIEELEMLIRKTIRACNSNKTVKDNDGFSENGWSVESSVEFDVKREVFYRNSSQFKSFLNELRAIRYKVDCARTPDEAFDGHMAIGRTLYDCRLLVECLEGFKRAAELKPIDVRPHFRMGNSFCSLGRLAEAKESYLLALQLAEEDVNQWSTLLPQVHVNLGIALEGEGMLLSASDHYREAAILCPTHYRALKLLGSALFGVGEYWAAEKALEEAVFLKPDYADAYCDLGSALHAMGKEERAIVAFQKVIDLKPDHSDALYNLGGLFMDVGRYQRAAEMYGRVLAIRPNHWRAQLNRAIALWGAGETEDAKRSLTDAFKMTKRVELYDAIVHMKQLKNQPKGGLSSIIKLEFRSKVSARLAEAENAIVVDSSKFKQTSSKATQREYLANALQIRAFQRITRLFSCDVSLLKMDITKPEVSVSYSENGLTEISIRKAALEVTLRKLLYFLKPEAFQGAIKEIDKRIFEVLDATGSGRVDLGMFYAIIAPVCMGPPDKRKRAAFDALLWRSMKGVQGQIRKTDASIYLRYLRVIYLPMQGVNDFHEVHEEENVMISYPEFIHMFEDMDSGFCILDTLVKLETGDRIRHCRHSCDVCRYPIIGPRFKETTSRFSLCGVCYSEGKVPTAFNKEEYRFKEYWT